MQIFFVFLCLTVGVLSDLDEETATPSPFVIGQSGIYFADVQSDSNCTKANNSCTQSNQFFNPIDNITAVNVPKLDISTNTGSQAAASSGKKIIYTGGAPSLNDVRILSTKSNVTRVSIGPTLQKGRVLHSAIWFQIVLKRPRFTLSQIANIAHAVWPL